MNKMMCLGQVIGIYSKKEAEALGKPAIAGHKKRGGETKEKIYKTDSNGAVIVDDNDMPVIKKIITRITPCGQRLYTLYADVPEDGEAYFIKCPQCGNVSRVVRTPPDEVEIEG